MGRRKKAAEPESESEEEQFHVEVITKARVNEDGDGWEYFVKWANYPPSASTWEPEENVAGCDRLLASFWEHVGVDNKDYTAGHEIPAEAEWIEKEKKFFKKHFTEDTKSRDKAKGKAKAPEPSPSPEPTKKRGRKSSAVNKKTSTSAISDASKRTRKRTRISSDSNDSDDVSLSATKIKRRKKVARQTDDDSDGSDSLPLNQLKKQKSAQSVKPTSQSVPSKEKEDENPPPSPVHSLFSAPSSPDISLSQQLPSTSEPPSVPLPAHQDRVANPKVKMMDYPINQAPVLLTKQRITQKSASGSNLPKITIPKKNTGLSNLSFKKNTAPETQASMSPQLPSAPAVKPNIITDVQELVQSPIDFDMQGQGGPSHDPSTTRRRVRLPRRSTFHNTPNAEVENFLASVMPAELAAPMNETTEDNIRPLPTPTSSTPRMVKNLVTGRIPKKWKWSGELYLENGANKADRLCRIEMLDSTEARPGGVRLSTCLQSSVESIRLKKLHNISDIYMVLPACAAVQQFCKISHHEDADTKPLQTLEAYMVRKRAFAYAHMYLDDDPMSLLFVFPSRSKELCETFMVPQELREAGNLLVALVPWVLSVEEYNKNSWLRPRSDLIPVNSRLDKGYETASYRSKITSGPLYYRGLILDQIPKTVHDMMSRRAVPYCIWFQSSDGTEKEPGLETATLKQVLKKCGARDVGYKADVRAIFVHVGSLETLHKIGVVAARRNKRPELRFFAYGTHHTVPPSRWGWKEIYPIGGVVTVTPLAFLMNPWGACRLLDSIHEHPLWLSFITPCTLGYIAKLTSSDPIAAYDAQECICTPLLDMIEKGKLSLLTAPPLDLGTVMPNDYADQKKSWITFQIQLLPSSPRDVLQKCVSAFEAKFSTIEESQRSLQVAKDAVEEMYSMQLQPTIMEQYRRYVVIRHDKETEKELLRQTIEITTLNDFRFKDDYFGPQK